MIFSERRSSRSISHSSVLDSRDMNEGVSAAVVRLNEAEALGGIKPFNCASGHLKNPFIAIERPQHESTADDDSDF